MRETGHMTKAKLKSLCKLIEKRDKKIKEYFKTEDEVRSAILHEYIQLIQADILERLEIDNIFDC